MKSIFWFDFEIRLIIVDFPTPEFPINKVFLFFNNLFTTSRLNLSVADILQKFIPIEEYFFSISFNLLTSSGFRRSILLKTIIGFIL